MKCKKKIKIKIIMLNSKLKKKKKEKLLKESKNTIFGFPKLNKSTFYRATFLFFFSNEKLCNLYLL